MTSSREDAMFRAAIEASLRESRTQGRTAEAPSPSVQGEVVDLTFDSDSEHGSDLQQVFPKSKSVVGSDTDNEAAEDDDDDLRAAIALSLQGIPQKDDKDDDDESTTTKASVQPPKAQEHSQPFGFLGMDRKKMEEERLARLAKRKAADTDGSPRLQPAKTAKTSSITVPDILGGDKSPGPHPTKFIRIPDTHGSEPFIQRAPASRGAPPSICNQFAANDPNCDVRPTARSVPQWPLGAVKQTATAMGLRQNNDITIEEVLQRGDLEAAVLSSFMFDVSWLFSKLNYYQTSVILMMHAKEEQQRREWTEESQALPNVRLCFPPMNGLVTCMHSKLMLLFHPDYLRIAVPTANLTATDWGENNLMENTVFLIDLPKRAEKDMPPNSKPAFYHDLVYFLKATTLDEKVIKKLESFDFSKTARYAFVHSIGGSHRDGAWNRNGFCGLGRAVNSLGLRSVAPVKVDYVTSSVGSLTDDLLRAIHLACKGDDGLTDYAFRTTQSPFTFQAGDPNRTSMLKCAKEWRDRFTVYFPSERTVRATHSDPGDSAGTICFQSSYWNKPGFPRHVMRDCEGKRDVLMHNKLLYVTLSKPIILHNKTVCKGWAYVGSANLSESAWGRLVKDRETKQPKLNCRNWECGVIVPVTSEYTEAEVKALKEKTEQEQTRSEGRLPDVHQRLAKMSTDETAVTRFPSEIFRDTIPVPMKTPAKEFSRDEERGEPGFRKPWFYMEDVRPH